MESWSWSKFISGPFNVRNYAKVAVYATCVVVVLLIANGALSIYERFFPRKSQATQASRVTVKDGGVATITNVTNTTQELHQGIYGELSSNSFGVGVFKEVMPNIDISLGISKPYDEDELEFEVQTRLKF